MESPDEVTRALGATGYPADDDPATMVFFVESMRVDDFLAGHSLGTFEEPLGVAARA